MASLTVCFTKSNYQGYSLLQNDNTYHLNFTIINSIDFKESPKNQLIFEFLQLIEFRTIKVFWVGMIPDIELTEFLESLNYTELQTITPESTETSNSVYPTVFNPFMVPSTPSTPGISSTSGTSSIAKTNDIRFNLALTTDMNLIMEHVKKYPSHPNFQDRSAKNMVKVYNYIRTTLGRNIEKDYADIIFKKIAENIPPE